MYIGIENQNDSASVIEYLVEHGIKFKEYTDPMRAVCYERIKESNKDNGYIETDEETSEILNTVYDNISGINRSLDTIISMAYDIHGL